MTYHSESITRRYIGHSRFLQIKNNRGMDPIRKDAKAKFFSEEWEACSLESASFAQKSEYFAIGASFLGGMTWVMLMLSFLLLQMFGGFGWGAAIGYLFLPFTICFSIWASFAWRSNQSKMIKDYFSPFTGTNLILAVFLGILASNVLVLFLLLVIDPTVERWI